MEVACFLHANGMQIWVPGMVLLLMLFSLTHFVLVFVCFNIYIPFSYRRRCRRFALEMAVWFSHETPAAAKATSPVS